MFAVGDVVTLKSGGPKMTVCHTFTDKLNRDCAACRWFDVDDRLQDQTFLIETLKAEEATQ